MGRLTGAAAWRWALAGVLAAGLLIATLVLLASSWHRQLAQQARVLPGITIAGIDVGGAPAHEALAVARGAADAALDWPVTVAVGEAEQTVTPRSLGATADEEAIVAAALDATAAAGWGQIVAARWLGGASDLDVAVTADIPEGAIAELVEAAAAGFDRSPRDAALAWERGVQLRAEQAGRKVDRAAAAADVRAALAGGADRVELPTIGIAPAVTAADIERVLPGIARAIDAALERTVTLRHDDTERQVRPRDLVAVPDLAAVLDSALAAAAMPGNPSVAAQRTDPVPMTVPHWALTAYLDSVAAAVDRSPQDAFVDYSSGWIEIQEERAGRALDRERAAAELRDALRGAADLVELPVADVAPEITAEDYRHVLLVRQDQRRLYLYVEGEIVRDWPVAIGAGRSPTPTGEFSVGVKRHRPSWHNPAPNGWGAGMPRVIGPGATNPLGLRALNWNRAERDTLIRFHGTSDTGSIGRAASRGCVRLTNADVIELYDLVPTGAVIVSLRA